MPYRRLQPFSTYAHLVFSAFRIPEVTDQGVSVVKVHECAVALADVAGEVHGAHVLEQVVARVHAQVAELTQRVLLLVALQLPPCVGTQLQWEHSVRLSSTSNE